LAGRAPDVVSAVEDTLSVGFTIPAPDVRTSYRKINPTTPAVPHPTAGAVRDRADGDRRKGSGAPHVERRRRATAPSSPGGLSAI